MRAGGKSAGLPGRSTFEKSEGPGRQSGPRSSFLSRAGYGVGSRPPGVGPSRAALGVQGEELPPKLHLNRLLRAVVKDDELDRVARLVLRDHVAELVDRGSGDAVGLVMMSPPSGQRLTVDDAPARRALEPGLRRAAPGSTVSTSSPCSDRQLKSSAMLGVDRLSLDTEDRVLDVAALDDLRDDVAHRVARDRRSRCRGCPAGRCCRSRSAS